MATDSECIEICEALQSSRRETQGDWPWRVFMAFPTMVRADHGGIQRALVLWWFAMIDAEIWGDYVYVGTELDVEGTKELALSAMDLLAKQCRLTMEAQ